MRADIQKKVFDKLTENHDIRTATNGDDLWFCLKDTCEVLGIKNSRRAKESLSSNGIVLMNTPTEGGIQKISFINEANLYRLIFRSRKPAAVTFRRWVCEEVLPSIRKTGMYFSHGVMGQDSEGLLGPAKKETRLNRL